MRIFGQFLESPPWAAPGPAVALLPTTRSPADKATQRHAWLLPLGEAASRGMIWESCSCALHVPELLPFHFMYLWAGLRP